MRNAWPYSLKSTPQGLLVPQAKTSNSCRVGWYRQMPALIGIRSESGVPGYAVSAWVGLFAPAGTPPAVITRLNTEIRRVLGNGDVRERILKAQMEPAPMSAEEFTRFMSAESKQWGSVIESAGIKAE